MRGQVTETIVGLAVLILAGLFVNYAMKTVNSGGSGADYHLKAHFGSIGSIDSGSDIRLAGVKVGVVNNISLDTKTYDALVDMSIHANIPVPVDSTAKITTDGLLGSAYISIEPGAEEDNLAAGDSFDYTQGAVDLLTLLGQVAGQSSKKSEN